MKTFLPLVLISLIYSSGAFAQGNTPCAATPITVESTCSYTTYNNSALTDSNEPVPGCGDYDLNNTEDAWFYFIVPASGNVTLIGNDVGLADIVFAVYTGLDCGSLTEIECIDDIIPTVDKRPKIHLFNRTPGERIWLRVFDFEGNDVGDFDICATYSTTYELDAILNGKTINSCSGTLFDLGGEFNNYTNSLDVSVLIAPNAAESIEFVIQDVDISDAGDTLYIYQGPNTGYPAIKYHQNNDNGEPFSHHVLSGSVLIRFVSDAGSNGNGFDIDWQGIIPSYAPITKQISCNGDTDGEITAFASGTSPYTYNWSNLGTDQTETGLGDDTYYVTITDKNGCIGKDTITLSEPSALSVTVSTTNITCNGLTNGTAEAFPVGGTSGYTYLWSHAASTTKTISGLGVSNYIVTVTDSHGCTASGNNSVTQPVALSATINNNISCNGASAGSATVNAGGGTAGYTYLWTTGATTATASGLSSGSYTVTVTDSNNCTQTASTNITQPTILTASISGTNVACNGASTGSATVTAGGGTAGYTYLWTGGETTFTASGLAAGAYTVTVTDANTCTTTASITISQPSALSATVTGTNPDCNGAATGFATVSAVGGTPGYSYLWTGGATAITATNLVAGSYTVTVTDANSCTTTANTSLTQPTAVTATIAPIVHVTCNGASTGSATVTAGGGTPGYTYLWTGGATTATASGLSAGSYTVVVNDSKGCQAISSATITQPTGIVASSIVNNHVTCNGDSDGEASVSATGGTGSYTYDWSPNGGSGDGSDTYSGLSPGAYSVTVEDGNGCTVSSSVTINQNAVVTASAILLNNVSCNGGNNGSAMVNAGGGTGTYTYLWSNGATTSVATGLTAGVYNVTVSDVNGCSANTNITINESTLLSASISASINVSCFGGNNGSITVSTSGGTPGYTYLWSNGQTGVTATSLVAGNYSVTVSDLNNCKTFASQAVYQNPLLNADASVVSNALCNGSSNGIGFVTANGGTGSGTYTYSWPSGGSSATETGLAAGTYTVTVTDGNLCNATDAITIGQPIAISATTAINQPTCNGGDDGEIIISALNGTVPYSYSIDGSNFQSSATFSGLSAGSYSITVSDINGCTYHMPGINMPEPAAINVTILNTMPATYQVNDTADLLTDYVTVSGVFTGPGVVAYTQEFHPSVAGVGGPYEIVFTHINVDGCIGRDTAYVSVVESGAAITGLNTFYCYYDLPVTITGVPDTIPIPVVHSFSGNGIIPLGNNLATFSPSLAGPGYSTITYSYENPYNLQTFSIQQVVFVDSVGQVNFITLNSNYCENDATLYDLSAVDLFPSGGTGSWTTTLGGGFTSINNSASLRPNLASPGTYSISYRYETSYGCFDDTTKTLEISPLPIVDFSIREIYNRVEPPSTLVGDPVGGVFSGTGMFGNDFRPAEANIGVNNILYTYTNLMTGCSNSFSKPTTVQIAEGSITGLNIGNQYCWDGEVDTLYGLPINSNGSPGVFSISSSGITTLGTNSAVFDPEVAGSGNHTITFTYTGTDNIVQFELSVIVNVDSISPVNYIGLDTSYCISNGMVILTGVPPESGIGEFYGIAAPALSSAGHNAFLYPELLLPDSTYSITYELTASTGCKRNITKDVTIYDLPVVFFDLRSTFNIDEGPYTLIGYPAGGVFNGNGVSGNQFYPNIANLGSHEIEYTYTDSFTCTNSIILSTEVILAEGQILGINPANQYCFNGIVDTLIGQAFNSNGAPGYFTGVGITAIGNDSIIFDPSIAGPGNHDIVYHFVDGSGTNLSISETLKVDFINPVSIIGLNSSYCTNNSSDEIYGNPANGAFSGAGMVGNQFFPSMVAPGITTITYTITNPSGCSRDTSISLMVYDIPAVSFTVDSQFCSNASPVEIIGYPANGFFSGPNLSGTDTVIFSPNTSVVGTHDISYTYTDPATGCTNTALDQISVDLVKNLSITSLSSGYCINSDYVLITGLIGGVAEGFGGFSGAGIYDANNNDGIAYFHPVLAGVGGPFTLHYTYTDDNGCNSSYYTDVFVYDLPIVSIANLAPGYCQDMSSLTINGFPQNSNGTFTYTGGAGLYDQGDGTALFYPNTASPLDTVIYTYTDGNSCTNVASQKVFIYNLPVVSFDVGDACIVDSISFTDLTTSDDLIEIWYWNFGDIGSPENTSNLQNPKHFYFSEGNKTISLTVTTESGCQNTYTRVVELGSKPNVSFSWTNECFDPAAPSSTQFINTSSDLNNVYWEFGDGAFSTEISPGHIYADASTYDVTLIVVTPNQCADTLVQEVSIRPYVSSFPYSQDFENGNGGWVSDALDEISSWQFGNPNKTIINGAASGDFTWCTNLTDNYYNNEKSTVVGPCFDFTNMKRPMIKMKIWGATQNGSDGAILQYRIDGVTDWENVGGQNTGINWCNGVGIYGNPGGVQNVGSYGWTGNTEGWTEVRHNLDILKGHDNVRFRIAFGSDGNGSFDGFAFDDIWIGERSRIVLMENFTNSSDGDCADVNPDLYSIIDNSLGDVLAIQYHTSYPGFDPMNNDYPAGPSARSMYYGTSSVPWTVLGGNAFNGLSEGFTSSPLLLELKALEDPLFNIELTTENTGSSIEIDATIQALGSLYNRNITCHLAVVEKEITTITGTNGEVSFRSVLRKMLPNAAGTNYSHNWSLHQSESISTTWSFENIHDPDQVYVIAFVQDEDSREIYQATSDDSTLVFTGIGQQQSLTSETSYFKIYPNPAKNVINILFSKVENQEKYIEVYNSMGQLVEIINIKPETIYMVKDIEDYAEGMYFLVLKDKNKILELNKLIIAY
jgi:hypothetical protein